MVLNAPFQDHNQEANMIHCTKTKCKWNLNDEAMRERTVVFWSVKLQPHQRRGILCDEMFYRVVFSFLCQVYVASIKTKEHRLQKDLYSKWCNNFHGETAWILTNLVKLLAIKHGFYTKQTQMIGETITGHYMNAFLWKTYTNMHWIQPAKSCTNKPKVPSLHPDVVVAHGAADCDDFASIGPLWGVWLRHVCRSNLLGREYPSSHNHGSGKWVPQILVSFHLGWFSTFMIMGERVNICFIELGCSSRGGYSC